jgi:diguanylate cyclase (GGDEF)-like protein/PAS domain S-box-containing protein
VKVSAQHDFNFNFGIMEIEKAFTALSLVESMTDGIALFDPRNVVIYANRKFCSMWNMNPSVVLGMTQGELRTQKLAMLSDPEKDANLLSNASEIVASDETHYIQLKTGMWYERVVFDHMVRGECQGHVVQWRDVTRRHNAMMLVQAERDLLHSMMDSVPHQIYFKDTESRFTRVNNALAARYGLLNTRDVIGKSDADFYSAEHAAQTRQEELEIMSKLTPQLNQLHHEVWSDGTDAWNVSTKMPLIDSKGNVIGVYGIAHDITDQKRSEAIIWRQANFDALTNLPNRRLMRDRWEQAALLHDRNGSLLALMLIDLDRFKAINDTKGHAVGDDLLIQAAKRMSECLRAADTLARLGGDEFAVILSEVSDAQAVAAIANKILTCLHTPFDLSGDVVQISGSLGFGMWPAGGQTLDELLRHADKAMYQVKSKGGNGCAFFSTE